MRAERRSLLLPINHQLLDMIPVPRVLLHALGNVPLRLRTVEGATWRDMQRAEEASFARALRADTATAAAAPAGEF